MPKSRSDVKRFVAKKITKEVLSEAIQYIQENYHSYGSMWGMEAPKEHVADMAILAFYKDLTGHGYKAVVQDINFKYKITHKSLEHNVHIVRETLFYWAQSQFDVGNLAVWNSQARDAGLKSRVKKANIWFDSTDVRTQGRSRLSKKSIWWSYKENSPGRRYMLAMDAKGHALGLWGGYSPKQHDSDFLRGHRQELAEKFDGGTVIADNHFSEGKKLFTNIAFLINFANRSAGKKRKREEPEEESEGTHLTKEQQAFNKDHRHGRARVESPFGWMKKKFMSLQLPWAEKDCEQLDYLVYIAVAIYTRII